MDETTIELQIYNPRWGHEDTYTLELSRDALTITPGDRWQRTTHHRGCLVPGFGPVTFR